MIETRRPVPPLRRAESCVNGAHRNIRGGTPGPQSRPRHRLLGTLFAASLLLSLIACGGGDDNNDPAPSAPPPANSPAPPPPANDPAPPAPATTGSIQITTATTGGAPDADGYSIAVDGAAGQSVGAAATIVISNVAPGSRTVTLTGEANNCTPDNNPRAVTVTAGATTPITFDVSCPTNTEILSARPFAPTDRTLFVPRAYPDTPPLAPAQGTSLTEQQAQEALRDYLRVEFPNDVNAQNAATAVFTNPVALRKIANPSLRAGFAALTGTIGEPAIDFYLNATTPGGLPKVRDVKFAIPGQLGELTLAETFIDNQTGQLTMLFNLRYQAENPFLFTAVLAHEALHQDSQDTNFEEIVIRSLDWLILIDQFSRHPELAQIGTELARQSNTRALTRLNSGIGPRLGLFQSNGNNPILPGSPDEITSWFAQFTVTNSAATPGNALLGQMLARIQEAGKAVCSAAEFSRALLDCISENQGAVSDEELVAAAKALKLDIRQSATTNQE